MKRTIIHDLPKFRVTSYGNGLAYELANKPESKAVFFQGEDAERFRSELDSLTCPKAKRACLSYHDALVLLWSDYTEISQDWEPTQ